LYTLHWLESSCQNPQLFFIAKKINVWSILFDYWRQYAGRPSYANISRFHSEWYQSPLSRAKQRAICQLHCAASAKIFFQTRSCFWENEKGIIGGGKVTDLPIRTLYLTDYGRETEGEFYRQITPGPKTPNAGDPCQHTSECPRRWRILQPSTFKF
jgi:hypothetical protein